MILNSCFLISVSIVTAVCILLWQRYTRLPVAKRQKYLEYSQPSPVGMIDFVFTFAIWLGAPAATLIFLPFDITDLENLSANQRNVLYIVLASAQLLSCLLILVYLGLIRYGSLSWMLNLRPSLSNQVVLAAKAFCMIVPGVLAVQALLSLLVPYEHDTLSQLAENFSAMTVFATWLGAVVSAPICEELVFRGVLQSWLQRAFARKSERDRITEVTGGWPEPADGKDKTPEPISIEVKRIQWWLPILISSGLFAVIHLGQGAAPIPLFLFATGLGFLFRYSGSLVPCIILHFMLNGFTMFWMTLQLIFEPVTKTV